MTDESDGHSPAPESPELEIEVTEEMIRGGVLAFCESDPRCEEYEEIMVRVFLAMLAARAKVA